MALPARRSYAGAAEACTLTSNISNSATSFSITGTTTAWPSTATGPFYMVIDPGLSTEEKVLVGARTTGSLSSVTRGVDGTSAAAHDAGATCYPVLTAVDLNEANLLASTLTTKGDLISTDGSDPKRVAVGSNNTRLVADSAQTSGIKWVADTQNTVVDAKGDLLVGSAADTVARLAVSTTDGAVLIADSTATNGVSWQTQNTGVRNLVHNGAMQVAQRSTSIGSLTATDYRTADRWVFAIESLGTWTNSVEADAPTGSGFRKSFKVTLNSGAEATPGASDQCYVAQKFEGQDLQAIKKGTSSAEQLTLSFWVKSNVTGTYIVGLYDQDNTRHVNKSYTINSSATWEFKTVTFPADTTGAFDNDANLSMWMLFFLAEGSNFTSGTLATTWASYTAANRAVGQVNLAATNNNYWQMTGVQLNVGSVTAPFEFKSFERELRECQRYYEKSFPYDVAPETNNQNHRQSVGASTVGTQSYATNVYYKVPKRASSNTITLYNPWAASNTANWYKADGTASTTTAIEIQSDTQFSVVNSGANYVLAQLHWACSAEL